MKPPVGAMTNAMKQWLQELGLRYRSDNPGGEWLARKQADAAARTARTGFPQFGATTGYFMPNSPEGRNTALPFDTKMMSVIPGARNEARRPGEAQFDALLKQVEREGFNKNSPALIGVNHKGLPYILEGNTRFAVARHIGEPSFPADLRYFDGGEENTLGPLSLYDGLEHFPRKYKGGRVSREKC